jgi:hypothetical protein
MRTLTEGQFGWDYGIINYPKVSSCITVSCICKYHNANFIFGIHGTQFPDPSKGHKSISELLNMLEAAIRGLDDKKLIIACDLDFWNNDGNGLNSFNYHNFNFLADYLSIFKGEKKISGVGTYGNCQIVDVGGSTENPYYDKDNASATFLVNVSGILVKYELHKGNVNYI